MKKETGQLLKLVREMRPLVHHITNYVTVNDCANITLCAGGSPVMSDEKEDVTGMVNIASSLVLNTGTLNERIIDSMIVAGKAANKKGIPVILDPVGVGATAYRTDTIIKILKNVKISVIKGNGGEIGSLAGAGGKVRGVDSGGMIGDPVETCIALAKKYECVVAMTGALDIVSDGKRTAVINNGDAMMESVSGTGCMAASVIGCYTGVTDDYFTGAVAALAVFSIAGSKAAKNSEGPGSFIMNLKDELSSITTTEVVPLANIRMM